MKSLLLTNSDNGMPILMPVPTISYAEGGKDFTTIWLNTTPDDHYCVTVNETVPQILAMVGSG